MINDYFLLIFFKKNLCSKNIIELDEEDYYRFETNPILPVNFEIGSYHKIYLGKFIYLYIYRYSDRLIKKKILNLFCYNRVDV